MPKDPEYTDPLDELFADASDDAGDKDKDKEADPDTKAEDDADKDKDKAKKEDKADDKKDVIQRAPVQDVADDKREVITSANSSSVAYNRDIRDIEDQIEEDYPGKFTRADKRSIMDQVEAHAQGDPKVLREVLEKKMYDPVAKAIIGEKFMKGQLKDPKQVLKREGSQVGGRQSSASKDNSVDGVVKQYFGGDPKLAAVFAKGKK